MGFLKYASAAIVQPSINASRWDEVRQKATAAGSPFDNRTAAQVLIQEYGPDKYLLSHCTIIASVDTESPQVELGRQMVDGVQIDRRYADFYITPNTSKYVNNNCFVAGTMILMADGTEKPIEQVAVGDLVISHTGFARRVTETFVRPFRGQLRVVRRLGDARPLEVTPEHPLFAMTPAVTCACGCGTPLDRRARKAAVHRFQDYVQGHGARPRKNPKPDYGWVSAGLLAKGDFLSSPRLQGEVRTDVTPEKARLLGYYLAEGFYHRQKQHRVSEKCKVGAEEGHSIPVGVSFALNLDETDTLVSEIRALLASEFNVGSSVQRVSEGGVTVHSQQSVELVQFFKRHATEYARTKKLLPHVLQWPLHLQRELIRGWIEGDGCVEGTAGGWVSVTSASPDLISQMQVIFTRLGVFATRHVSRTTGRRRVHVSNGSVQVVSDPTKECVSYRLQVGSTHAEMLLGGSFLEPLFRRSIQGRRKQSLRFRVRDDRAVFPVRSVTKAPFEGSVYNFETEQDHSYVANGVAVHNCDAWERKLLLASFKSFIGGENYVEHVQIPELSKGKIVDAVARDIGDSIYVDILVATDLKHRPLITAITGRQLQTLSMGCQVAFTVCTKCGNVAEDETQLCPHIKYYKGSEFVDELGRRRKIAELCGHAQAEPGSCKFIEASWVANPAFTGAVLRSILMPSEMTPELLHKVQAAFSQPVHTVDPHALQKAASLLSQDLRQSSRIVMPRPFVTPARATPTFAGHDPQDLINASAIQARSAHYGAPVRTMPSDYRRALLSAQEQFFPGDNQGGTQEKPAENSAGDPLDGVVEELYTTLRDKVMDRVRKDLGKSEADGVRNTLNENKSNESLIRSAVQDPTWKRRARVVYRAVKGNVSLTKKLLAGLILFDQGGWKAVRQASRFSGTDCLALAYILDRLTRRVAMAGERRIYRTVIAVGGTGRYQDVKGYLAACRQVMGRNPTYTERVELVAKGTVYSMGL